MRPSSSVRVGAVHRRMLTGAEKNSSQRGYHMTLFGASQRTQRGANPQ